MEYPHLQDDILEKFKRNDEVFRNTMERILQKYSNLEDPGMDVCFKTMTFRTRKGAVVPIESAEAECELQQLKTRLNAEQSLQDSTLDSSKNEQVLSEQDMDDTQRTEQDVYPSNQTENRDESWWPDTATSQLSLTSETGSQSCLWGEQSQPEEDDEVLERTLDSHGSTLLDVYPSMLNQIGEAYRREHVTQAANAVLRRYRRRRWKASQAQPSNHTGNSLNCTLNQTKESSFSVHDDMTSHRTDMSSYRGAPPSSSNQEPSSLQAIRNSSLASSRGHQELSPLKAIRNSSLASSRGHQELSPLNSIRNSSLASNRSQQELSPLKAIRNSSLASSRGHQELSPLKAIRKSSLAASTSRQELSPLKAIRNSSLASTRSQQELSPLKSIRNSSLASSRGHQELSPLQAIRKSSLAASTSCQELSPLKAIRISSLAPSACLYSPSRVHVGESPVAESRSGSCLRLDSKPQHQPVRVLDLSTPPSSVDSSPRSPSPDLNQTYVDEPVIMPRSCDILASAVCSPSRSVCNSPLKTAKNSLLIARGGRSLATISPSRHCHSQLGQQFTSVGKERFRDHLGSPFTAPQQNLIGGPCSIGGSPFKHNLFSQELDQQTSSVYYPKQNISVSHTETSELGISPCQSLQGMSSSYHPVSDHQENLAMAEVYQPRPKPPMSQRSFSGHQLMSSPMPCTSSRQIDAEFRRLYHHFICRGTSSSCPTSSCHLCERHLEQSVQSTPTCTSNMSALALTPVQRRLKKRRRQSEVEEEPVKLKRFRESCSPISHTHLWLKQQQQQQQQSSEYMSTVVANPSEEGRTWNRALLLYCPSPEFLRARKGIRRVSESKPGLQMDLHSPSRIGPAEARSPMRPWNQSGVSFSPSMSRRRLLYGPLQ